MTTTRKHYPTGPLLTITDAADYLSLATRTIRRYVELFEIGHYRLGTSTLRFRQADLDDFIEARRVQPYIEAA